MMSDEELGLDTFIARDEDGNKSITVKGTLRASRSEGCPGLARIIGDHTITRISGMRYGLTFEDKCHDFKSVTSSTVFSFHSQPLNEPCRLDVRQQVIVQEAQIPKGMQTSK
ncbi:hypothetical protein ACJ73_08678 [Blastomyces percursus]|uniref:Uncharacterized protein n=1 Tax=Blastomyces percursus TaxID=1658174 RepID=A0A1J9PR86_9EURO|nr:hypothetical protein ACJ73_08678 [Blastomyces percursus]